MKRARQKLLTMDSHVTSRDSHATDKNRIDKDIYKENIIKEKEKPNCSSRY